MVDRIEEEYEVADFIRVSSNFAKQSLTRHGVPAGKIFVCPLPVNRSRFAPPPDRLPPDRPASRLLCRVFGPEKGVHLFAPSWPNRRTDQVPIRIRRCDWGSGSKALLARERVGLDVIVKPGDPVMAYHRAELFVLPSLEDGFGFVVAEAMSWGVPVVVTDQCGAAEWVRPGESDGSSQRATKRPWPLSSVRPSPAETDWSTWAERLGRA